MSTARLAVFWLLVFGFWLASSAYAQSLPEGWPHRRPLVLKTATSEAPGDNVAWAEFYTDGSHLRDGSDLRITTADRMQVPMQVLFVSGDHDLVRVAFAAKGTGEQTYYAWWGNPKPDKPAPELDIKRGILAEIFRFPGGMVDNEAHVRAAFQKAKSPIGALFVPELFLGHNPLGEPWTAMIRYRGQFRLDKPGTYDIAFGVGDRGYLAIDGETVLFQRGFVRDARHTKAVDLKQGWHTIEVTQINVGGGETGIVCAWRKKGDRGFSAIPGAIFAPVAEATPGPMETLKQTHTADFDVNLAAEVFIPPSEYAQRASFEARFPATIKPGLTWDFGDGQIVKDIKKVHHIFLTPGIYPVTLTMQLGPSTFATTHRIAIKDRLYARFPNPPEDPFKVVQAVLEKYAVTRLSTEQRFRGLAYFQKHNSHDDIFTWGQGWLEAKDTQPDYLVTTTTYELARLWEFKGKYKEAAEAYRLASLKQISLPARANAVRHYAMLMCDYFGDTDAATKLLDQWRKNTTAADREARFTLDCARMYVAIAKGDGKAAEALADEIGTRRNKSFNQQQIDQGVLTRNIENYIRTRDFDTATKLVNQWESDYPEAMVEGYSRILRVKLLLAQDRPDVAARVAVQHAKALPNRFYAAELLFMAQGAYQAAGKADEAKTVMDLLKSKYPESPYARQKPLKD